MNLIYYLHFGRFSLFSCYWWHLVWFNIGSKVLEIHNSCRKIWVDRLKSTALAIFEPADDCPRPKQKDTIWDYNVYRLCLWSDFCLFFFLVQPCSDSSDFREQQCSAYNDVPYEGQLFKWGVHHDEMEPCSLSCKTRSKDGRSTLVVQLAPKVQDGTRCRHGSLDMCISGKCQVSKRTLFLRQNDSIRCVRIYGGRCNKAATFSSALRITLFPD